MYIINKLKTFEEKDEVVEFILDKVGDKVFKENLNNDSTVIIAGSEYDAAEVLKKVDPASYEYGFGEWQENEKENILSRLDELEEGDTTEILGVVVKHECDSDDEED